MGHWQDSVAPAPRRMLAALALFLTLLPALPAPAAPASPTGRWRAETIRQGALNDRLQATLEITRRGQVSGSAGCNRISGSAAVAGTNIAFVSLVSTAMACTRAAMAQERRFIEALRQTRRFRVEPADRTLLLLDGSGAVLMRLASM